MGQTQRRRTNARPSASAPAAPAARPPWLRYFILLDLVILAAAAVWIGTHQGGPASVRRNVLLITMDTTRADYLGCYGRTPSRTPAIDAAARGGLRFTRCTTASPLTLPAHSSILTGMYPYAHGVRQNGTNMLAESNITLAELLRDAGYQTAATVASFVLEHRFGTAQGFAVYHDQMTASVDNDPVHAERKGQEVASDAVQLLHGFRADQPFFLWAHFYDPHFPYESKTHPDILSREAYEDEVAEMDRQIGRVLAALKEIGQEQNTLVVLVADHGEGLNDHDEWKHGYFLYETTIHTPLILRCPADLPAGQTIDAQVRSIDLAPTILAWARVPAPETMQGVDVAALWRTPGTDLHLSGYSETFQAQLEYGLSPLRALSATNWKYILAPDAELYDVVKDPRELDNRAAAEGQRTTEMRASLRALIASAPEPPAQTAVVLQESETRALAGLGYVEAGGPKPDEEEIERSEPQGGNPRDFARSFKTVSWDLPQLLARGETAQAEALLRGLIATLPNAAYLHSHLAGVLEKLGRKEEARAAHAQAVALAPQDYVVCKKYGRFLRTHDEPEAALAQYLPLLPTRPKDVDLAQEVALAQAALGREDEAEAQLQRAAQLDPQNAYTYRILGIIRERQGRLPEALALYRQALEKKPDFLEAQRDVQRVLQRPGL
jgi:choline-sulfatase